MTVAVDAATLEMEMETLVLVTVTVGPVEPPAAEARNLPFGLIGTIVMAVGAALDVDVAGGGGAGAT